MRDGRVMRPSPAVPGLDCATCHRAGRGRDGSRRRTRGSPRTRSVMTELAASGTRVLAEGSSRTRGDGERRRDLHQPVGLAIQVVADIAVQHGLFLLTALSATMV